MIASAAIRSEFIRGLRAVLGRKGQPRGLSPFRQVIRDQRCAKRSDGSTKALWSSVGAGGAAGAAAGPGCGRSAGHGGSAHPAPSPRLLPPSRISFLNLEAKGAQVWMVISFHLRLKINENSPLGQRLDFFISPRARKDNETCWKCSEPALQSFRQLERVTLAFLNLRNAFPIKILPVFSQSSWASLKRNGYRKSGWASLWERGFGQGRRSAESARVPV